MLSVAEGVSTCSPMLDESGAAREAARLVPPEVLWLAITFFPALIASCVPPRGTGNYELR